MFERIQLKKMNEHVYLMDDAGQATGYLVIGSTKALVIDTMNGWENVKAVVRSLTDLPVMVVNTHGHCDHIYGNIYFEEAYLHPADLPIAEIHMQFEEFRNECEKHDMHMSEFKPIHGGDTIDLGNLHLDVIELPGHTPGGILLLLKEDRILFTGDGINHHLWMQLEESLPLDELANNLDAVMYLKNEADYILHGHAREFDDISLMQKMRDGLQEILDQKTEQDESYKWFGGTDRIHTYDDGRSGICYKK